jgi:hypothetical protein
MYLVDRDADITDRNPTLANLNLGFGSSFAPQLVGSFDLVLTLQGEKTVIAGPVPLDLADGDVVEAVFVDTVDPMIADIILNFF